VKLVGLARGLAAQLAAQNPKNMVGEGKLITVARTGEAGALYRRLILS